MEGIQILGINREYQKQYFDSLYIQTLFKQTPQSYSKNHNTKYKISNLSKGLKVLNFPFSPRSYIHTYNLYIYKLYTQTHTHTQMCIYPLSCIYTHTQHTHTLNIYFFQALRERLPTEKLVHSLVEKKKCGHVGPGNKCFLGEVWED